MTDRTQFLQQGIYRALRALCKRMGVPDGEVPPDVTDYNNDWLTRDLYALREYDAWDRLPEAEKTRRRREADAAG